MPESSSPDQSPWHTDPPDPHWVRAGRMRMLLLAVILAVSCLGGGVGRMISGGNTAAAVFALLGGVLFASLIPYAARNVRRHWHDGGL